MRKLYFVIFPIFLIALVIFWHTSHFARPEHEEQENLKDDIKGAIEDRLFTTADVDSGKIPYDKLFKAIDEGQRRLDHPSRSRSMPGSIANPNWHERGPSNRGGRTRAIMIDESDPNRNRIWIGGVSGGLWRTEDITKANPKWNKLGLYFESLSISDIAQDPNDHNKVFVSTGESYTNDVQGAGIFRTSDDGATWSLIPSTINNTFQTVNELYVHTNGDIYVATSDYGLMRSKDNGGTWEEVLGSGFSGANSNNFHDFFFIEANQTFYTSNDNSIFKSTTGDPNDWIDIGNSKPGFPGNVNRVEFTVCPSDPNVMYAFGAIGSYSSNVFVSNDGGDTWTSKAEPSIFFTYGQAWYDLDLAVDPSNCLRLLAAGVGIAESNLQGSSWRPILTDMHTDNHNITFDPLKAGRVFFGNDGGIWLSENNGLSITDKSTGYVTTQFYAGAIHPEAGSNYIMGGTQDNNSLIIEDAGLAPSRTAYGGDGIFCFIDQAEPDYQIVSSQYGNYQLSIDGGLSFNYGASVDGEFINRSGYDSRAHILYGQVNQSGVDDVDFFRWNVKTGQVDLVDVVGFNIVVTAVNADPNVSDRVYFGGQSGLVLRTDNTSVGNPQGNVFADLPGNASVSCIYLDKLSTQDALISLFNFGASLENVWVTNDDGANWTAIEGDLPDIPVRWAIFDPTDHHRAMIATDAGIWTTDDINGDLTHWEPTNPVRGMPFVRVDMLQLRESDNIVLAATYGRGLMTTDIFAAPSAAIIAPAIGYVGQPVLINGIESTNAQHFSWELGDNFSTTDSIFSHTYLDPGQYNIILTINGSITKTKSISILPYLPAPYKSTDADYGGDFETHPEHFAANNISGTGFQRGKSVLPGKDGTASGSNAWVLGINDAVYENNTDAKLYTPMFDMTGQGLYLLSFAGKYAVQSHNDGFRLEYSLDAGVNWNQLGNQEDDPNWYNYTNQNTFNIAFPPASSYFTNSQPVWTVYNKDISFLAGHAYVCFRYVFRSDFAVQSKGLAIDNFEITRYDGDLKTTITKFSAMYTGDQDITVTWGTGIEYQCRKFILERSYTGLGFVPVIDEPAVGIVSTFPHEYMRVDKSLRKVIYYRLNVINENPSLNYLYSFYTDTIVVRRQVDPDIVYYVLTNPFSDRINISFSSIINQQVQIKLFDTSGRLIRNEQVVPNNISYSLDHLDLIPGVYILTVQIGDKKPTAYKLFTAG
ncbi:MAG: PKD domain-containing protein [Saprospiraceae bacterium]